MKSSDNHRDVLVFVYSQSTTRLLGPSSGQGTGSRAQTCNRRIPADLRGSSLTTVPPTRSESECMTKTTQHACVRGRYRREVTESNKSLDLVIWVKVEQCGHISMISHCVIG
ncbi:hypothetical protein PoB_004973300 [Plakobranchus ocellatus]|uniref:Uncharacterized protein n=1 Tax=Plakobranchus ocellatus TaxID=259542 RepID=A0AAV4BUF0_9GAST|nr:hypothetical protein PoB_004973300 [Plakobranchus ocellatus]